VDLTVVLLDVVIVEVVQVKVSEDTVVEVVSVVLVPVKLEITVVDDTVLVCVVVLTDDSVDKDVNVESVDVRVLDDEEPVELSVVLVSVTLDTTFVDVMACVVELLVEIVVLLV
jgi:hypothetical protein